MNVQACIIRFRRWRRARGQRGQLLLHPLFGLALTVAIKLLPGNAKIDPAPVVVRNRPCCSSPASRKFTLQSGSVTSEYLVVTAGLLIVWVGIEIVLELIRKHNENYSATLELLF